MITANYLRVMARYNRWQNGAIYGAAARLTDEARKEDRGAFFGSIQGTLSHLCWADRIWLSRFDLITAPPVPQRESAHYIKQFDELVNLRGELDDLLIGFCDDYGKGPVTGDLTWFSGSTMSEATAPISMIFTHFFNHQAHHRGQAHAMLTAAGERTGDTDLFLMPRELWPN
jgi:uncharacterized damage-inducible protein DinB